MRRRQSLESRISGDTQLLPRSAGGPILRCRACGEDAVPPRRNPPTQASATPPDCGRWAVRMDRTRYVVRAAHRHHDGDPPVWGIHPAIAVRNGKLRPVQSDRCRERRGELVPALVARIAAPNSSIRRARHNISGCKSDSPRLPRTRRSTARKGVGDGAQKSIETYLAGYERTAFDTFEHGIL